MGVAMSVLAEVGTLFPSFLGSSILAGTSGETVASPAVQACGAYKITYSHIIVLV